jgi:aspartyl-tRNA(Asn)/glutamyl-tRNA(Gln) amidotransferase subunit B
VATVISQYELSDADRVEVLTSTANAIVSSSNTKLDDWSVVQNQILTWPRELVANQVHVLKGVISSRQAKEVQEAVLNGEGSADQIIERRGLKQISDSGAIEKIVDEVLAANAKQVEDYRAGKDKAFNSLVGQVMKTTKGKANPAQVNEILKRKLGR